MTTMDRRAFLRRGALFVPAATLAIEEAKSGLVTGWVRRLFPGFGPGTITRTLKYQGGYDDFAAYRDVMRDVWDPLMRSMIADLERDSAITELFARDTGSVGGGGLYIPITRGVS